jgi:hypothetical protein
MTTTQRSESMNAFFDGYVHSSTTLKGFVDQYDNALRKNVENESVADFNSFNNTISCISRFHFEKKFQEVYTITKFKEVQDEIREVMYCNISILKREGAICTYQVTEEVGVNMKEVCFNVYYNADECEVNCSCCWFESRRILCRHVISVLTRLDVTSLLEKYFLNQWRKDLKRKYKCIKSSYDSLSDNPSAERYDDLCKDMHALAVLTATIMEHYMEVKNHIHMLTKKFSGSLTMKFSGLSCEHSPPSQALPCASTTCNESIDSMAA